ncbi:hypothetical protein ACIBG8_36830 [Nonomuraea sp. NPDC050556]|uniref:hypothetical protein n=1 Tax=Nonomuraea sp. NPDC050556 TaxID=3364369 RepID=UPI003792C205
MTDFRASFDASIAFSNGGDLAVHGFRVDLPGPSSTEAEIGALFVASLGLLMTDEVKLDNVEIFAEPHKGTRGGPADRPSAAARGPVVDLTGPGTLLSRPVELAETVGLPAVVVRLAGARSRRVDVGSLAAFDVRGAAVLLDTAGEGAELTAEAADWLVKHGAALVGVDGFFEGTRPPLPAATGLTGLEALPPTGARFSAVPMPDGTAVRAFATLPA